MTKGEFLAYQPLSVVQWIFLKLGRTSVQYPIRCAGCASPTVGNRITGYRLTCSAQQGLMP